MHYYRFYIPFSDVIDKNIVSEHSSLCVFVSVCSRRERGDKDKADVDRPLLYQGLFSSITRFVVRSNCLLPWQHLGGDTKVKGGGR